MVCSLVAFRKGRLRRWLRRTIGHGLCYPCLHRNTSPKLSLQVCGTHTTPMQFPTDDLRLSKVSSNQSIAIYRCTSLNVIRDPYAGRGAQPVGPVSEGGASPLRPPPVPPASAPRDCRSLPATRSMSNDSVYTIVIRLPPDNMSSVDPERAPSIKMIHEDVPAAPNRTTRTPQPPHRGDSEFNLSLNPSGGQNHLNRRSSHIPDIRIPLNAKIIPKQLAGKTTLLTSHTKQQAKKKKKSQEKKQETKAAKTLSAILLSFIITWTPYNILVLLKPLTNCADVIPEELWHFFYALCYINSTINPMCYALCNASFRRTYVRILTCKWHNRNREAISRGVYNWDHHIFGHHHLVNVRSEEWFFSCRFFLIARFVS